MFVTVLISFALISILHCSTYLTTHALMFKDASCVPLYIDEVQSIDNGSCDSSHNMSFVILLAAIYK